jgi:hypothetical protein
MELVETFGAAQSFVFSDVMMCSRLKVNGRQGHWISQENILISSWWSLSGLFFDPADEDDMILGKYEVTLLLTVGQSVTQSVSMSGCRAHSGTCVQIFFLSERCTLKVAVFFLWGVLSDDRTGLQSVNGTGHTESVTILCRLIWDSVEDSCQHSIEFSSICTAGSSGEKLSSVVLVLSQKNRNCDCIMAYPKISLFFRLFGQDVFTLIGEVWIQAKQLSFVVTIKLLLQGYFPSYLN